MDNSAMLSAIQRAASMMAESSNILSESIEVAARARPGTGRCALCHGDGDLGIIVRGPARAAEGS